jgi:hypothetical protein
LVVVVVVVVVVVEEAVVVVAEPWRESAVAGWAPPVPRAVEEALLEVPCHRRQPREVRVAADR